MVVKRGWSGASAGVAASAVGVALLLSGCGGGDGTVSVAPPSSHASASAPTGSASRPTASTTTDNGAIPSAISLIHTARATDAKATSAHLVMRMTAPDGSKQVIDIRGTVDGSNQQATTQDDSDGTATIRTVSGNDYVRGNQAFWQKQAKMPATEAGLLENKWILASPTAASSLELPTIDQLLDDVLGPKNITDNSLKVATVTRSTLNGVAVYVINANDGSGDTITVSADGKATPLRMAGSDDGPISITMDGWNTQAPITAPSGAINQPTV
ncbi:hypothetical protein [Rudaeicoccus suwonensis]|uniref:Lipoprotein LprG n=1 Tax=Rudaeicoccus suwonensis TaxID=657409 RepID=A0A561E6T9_9MICO|nr:hypothetical protein [Rudaeicoccus suwonensis]TWE11323.1 hypothetical protein BKA23_0085 [Rudaeicoccus suwonensis]